jgi:hypothetical protein
VSEEWSGSWEANELAQLRWARKLTFRQKLQWNENMIAFARELKAAPRYTMAEYEARKRALVSGLEPASPADTGAGRGSSAPGDQPPSGR